MRSSFSDQEIADYRRDGFLAVDDFLDAAELARWRAVVDAAATDPSAQTGTVWVALDDSTVANGCLYFVPGSHRLGLTAAGDLGPDLGAVFAAHPEAATVPVPCPLPAGGCSFHNGRTVHGAAANMTPGRRRAMTAAFMPDGVRFNGTRDARVLGAEYLDRLAPGDRLDDDELVALVHPAP